MFINSEYDFFLMLAIILIIFIGLIFIYSASSIEAYKKVHDENYFLKRQLVNILIGLILFIYSSSFLNLYKFKKYSGLLFFVSIILLFLVFIPKIGVKSGGAFRWINLKFFKLQPSEIVKITLIFFYAYFFEKKHYMFYNNDFQKKYFLIFFIITLFVSLLIVKEPDFSTTILFFTLSISLLYIMGFRLSYIIFSLILMFILGGIFLYLSPYRMRRIIAFLNPWADPLDKGYHIIQSYFAISRGGILGQGIGNSILKSGYLPEAHTDFIFSIICEEVGLIGALFIIFIYLFIIYRGFKIAYNNINNPFNFIFAIGFTFILTFHFIINIAVVTGVFPTTGITLPFISYGGSSLIVFLFSAGILINISREM
ncbi:MAG TPA: putative lipid II flippase FtsW [bacterium]|nr:putative lipid II flippase FtsW [bacterium]